ncbi:MAG: hypothetical protein WCW63_00790 [Acholeplasmataceae bacterium]|jgi:hypothetical protein
MINLELLQFMRFFQAELTAACPWDTHNMQNSIKAIVIDDNIVDVIIPVSYASRVNGGKAVGGNSDKHKGWVERVATRCAKCYAQNVNDDDLRMGLDVTMKVLMGREQ